MLAKACVNRAFESSLSDGISHERQVFHSLFGTQDQREGMQAFIEKRKPVFKHR
jgi:enoyl-CoA hydratase